MEAFQSFLGAVFTLSLPSTNDEVWPPFNITKALDLLRDENATYVVRTGTNFSFSLLVLLLLKFRKIILLSALRFFFGVILPPFSVLIALDLPPKSKKLYDVLRGEVPKITDYGRKFHDDLKLAVLRGA